MTTDHTHTAACARYAQCVELLAAIPKEGVHPKLEATTDMLSELGLVRPPFEIVQIAGTNGKTSTSRFTAAILRSQGLSCGLFTSPHLVSYTERFEIDGVPCSEELFVAGINKAVAARDAVNTRRVEAGLAPYDVTEFALLTVAAIWIFTEAACDVVVLEVGMGGRWDPTTALTPKVAAISGIDLDHTSVLGNTRKDIANEKAGVIRSAVKPVLGRATQHDEEVRSTLNARCTEVGVTPYIVGETEVSSCMPILAGRPIWQAENIALAYKVCEVYLAKNLPLADVQEALTDCVVPGRFECLCEEPLIIVDASHNPQGIRAFIASVSQRWPEKCSRPALLVAMLEDKDYRSMTELLSAEFCEIVVTQTSSSRALSAHVLAHEFEQAGSQSPRITTSVAEAIQLLGGKSYIACGSVTLVGELMNLLR